MIIDKSEKADFPDMEREIWKQIPGYEGIYDASNLGRIRSSPGKVTFSKRHGVRRWKSRILKQKIRTQKRNRCRRIDYSVTLWKDGVPKDYLVSRLVAMTWHGIPEIGMTVNHINGNPEDNNITNLEWLSRADNITAGFKTGLYASIERKIALTSQTGEIKECKSFTEADRFLGRHVGYTSCAVGRGRSLLNGATGISYSYKLFSDQ